MTANTILIFHLVKFFKRSKKSTVDLYKFNYNYHTATEMPFFYITSALLFLQLPFESREVASNTEMG